MTEPQLLLIARAIADPTRLRILRSLAARGPRGSMNCTQVCGMFRLSQPTISHHVRTLEKAGLITIEPSGQFHALSLNRAALRAFSAQLSGRPHRASGKKTPK